MTDAWHLQKAATTRSGRAGAGARAVVRCMAAAAVAASDAAQLKSAREDIREILKTTYCHPIMVRNARAISALASI